MMDDYFKILKNRADTAGDDGIYEWAFNEIRGLRVHIENLQEELNNQEDLNDMYKEENEQMRMALEQYRDAKYQGYASLPCGWDDTGKLAKYTLDGKSLHQYVEDTLKQNKETAPWLYKND